MDDDSATVREVEELTQRMRAQLVGRDPIVSGAVIADLLAGWLHAHQTTSKRVKAIGSLLDHVVTLVEQYDRRKPN